MLDDFMTRATLAGIGVSLAAAPLDALLYGDEWHILESLLPMLQC